MIKAELTEKGIQVQFQGTEESFVNEVCGIMKSTAIHIRQHSDDIPLEAISFLMDYINLTVEALKEAAPKAAKRSIKDLAKDIGDYYEKNHDNN